METTVLRESLMQMAPPPSPLSPAPLPAQCPELDLTLTLTPERPRKPTLSQTRRRKVRFDVSSESRTKPGGSDPAAPPDPKPVSMVMPEPHRVHSEPRAKTEDDPPPEGRRSRLTPAASDEGGAELNTTLALRAELQKLKEAEFDSEKAVKEKLQNSVITQENFRASVAKGVNFPRSQHLYRALVSVTLSHDQLIGQVMRDRPALAPPTSGYSSKVQPRPVEGPDLSAFCTPQQLMRETPVLPGDQLPEPRPPRPRTRPPHATFHLHQHRCQWEA